MRRRLAGAAWVLACAAAIPGEAGARGAGYLFVSSERADVVTVLEAGSFAPVKVIPTQQAAAGHGLQPRPDTPVRHLRM
ncbi:hypothetical protein EBE87_21165 [Pseudoroseomonas wenyumeiae]|uniref:Uncharacterized protein n=1 Tax=Teichococcus wenyumeiae TaxID=2478470 RepID=A0A3A9JK49_9PROT|nr:hypothetical protein D6Z83_10800 [Pseudoroseomonas wenyumeiae]RMI19256.1 hypothetical protein EBE87_21165 [Pseudoroseomonas wenyumeiae]